MCGIAGFYGTTVETSSKEDVLRRMLTRIQHRGPDECGIYVSEKIALGSVRLSIIDLKSGTMPLSNQEESLWIVFNGEIFNYIEQDSTVFEKDPLEKLASENKLSAFRHSGFWQPMDTLRDKNVLEDLWNTGNPPWKIWE